MESSEFTIKKRTKKSIFSASKEALFKQTQGGKYVWNFNTLPSI